jgi:hypothetical protein
LAHSSADRFDKDCAMTTTIAERVLELLRITRKALDDDELARRLNVSPRQSINQVCRRLARDGMILRRDGADGKIVNELVVREDVGAPPVIAPPSPIVQEEPLLVPPGNSDEQRRAEGLMIAALGSQLGVELRPRRMEIDGCRVELDAADDELTVLVEAWAHQGPPKAAQKYKVLADAFKLIWVGSTIRPTPDLILCLSDEKAARHFATGRSWAAAALSDLGIRVSVVELPGDVRQAIAAAQRRQYR